MPFQIALLRESRFTVVTAAGNTCMREFVDLILSGGEKRRRAGDRRVLVNLLGVEGGLRFTEQFSGGDARSLAISHVEKLASVVPDDGLTPTIDSPAIHPGVMLRVFSSVEDAVGWLTTD